MQVLKNQVPIEAEINDLEEVMKSQPLAKDPSESHVNQAVPPPPTMLKGSIQPKMSPPTNIISDSFICYQDELFL